MIACSSGLALVASPCGRAEGSSRRVHPSPSLPTPDLHGGWPGHPLVRAGFFRPRSLPCLLHLISSSLHPSVSQPSQTVKACKGHTLTLHVPVYVSLPFSLSGFLLSSLQHVWCVAINKMAALSAMWQAI